MRMKKQEGKEEWLSGDHHVVSQTSITHLGTGISKLEPSR